MMSHVSSLYYRDTHERQIERNTCMHVPLGPVTTYITTLTHKGNIYGKLPEVMQNVITLIFLLSHDVG